jgi:hypothetical protein
MGYEIQKYGNGFLVYMNGWNKGIACKFASVEVAQEPTQMQGLVLTTQTVPAKGPLGTEKCILENHLVGSW